MWSQGSGHSPIPERRNSIQQTGAALGYSLAWVMGQGTAARLCQDPGNKFYQER